MKNGTLAENINAIRKPKTAFIVGISLFVLSSCIPTLPVDPNPGAGDPTKGALKLTLLSVAGLVGPTYGTYILEFYKIATNDLVVSKTEVFTGQPKVYNPVDAGDFYLRIKRTDGNYVNLSTGDHQNITITAGEQQDVLVLADL
jgi:hypothetical protein